MWVVGEPLQSVLLPVSNAPIMLLMIQNIDNFDMYPLC